jgi:hypothetical protein
MRSMALLEEDLGEWRRTVGQQVKCVPVLALFLVEAIR